MKTRKYFMPLNIILLFSFALIQSYAIAESKIIRTTHTGFYTIPQAEINSSTIKKTGTPIGKIHINDSAGEKPFFLQSKKLTLKNDDNIIFFADMLHGENTYQHPLDNFNGFTLSVGKKTRVYKKWISKKNKNKKLPLCESINTIDHLESNNLMIRVNSQQYKQTLNCGIGRKFLRLTKKGFRYPWISLK